MKPLTALGALVLLAAVLSPLPAAARDYVQDQAGMFSKQAIQQVDERIAAFNAATGKEIVVVTVPSLGGSSLQDAAAAAFAQQHVNGVLIFIARDDRRDIIVPDRVGSQAGWFTPDVLRSIRTQMESQFKNEAYDDGLQAGVEGVLAIYRSHVQGSTRSGAAAPASGLPAIQTARTNGVHISMFWWIIIAVVGFLILRSVMRAFAAPRYGPPGMPPGAYPPGGGPPAGYGPGYGGGGYGGGGGSFWSGLLGGLGGAWLGNEMFGRGGGGAIGPADAAQGGAADPGGSWGGDSGAGFQNDAGQADMSGASGGDWSGGGFGGDGGGGGDFGGGGGGDSGGGW